MVCAMRGAGRPRLRVGFSRQPISTVDHLRARFALPIWREVGAVRVQVEPRFVFKKSARIMANSTETATWLQREIRRAGGKNRPVPDSSHLSVSSRGSETNDGDRPDQPKNFVFGRAQSEKSARCFFAGRDDACAGIARLDVCAGRAGDLRGQILSRSVEGTRGQSGDRRPGWNGSGVWSRLLSSTRFFARAWWFAPRGSKLFPAPRLRRWYSGGGRDFRDDRRGRLGEEDRMRFRGAARQSHRAGRGDSRMDLAGEGGAIVGHYCRGIDRGAGGGRLD